MSGMIQWWETPEPEGEAPTADGLVGERLLGQRDGVAGLERHDRRPDLDPRGGRAGDGTAVMASNSSGICGVQTESRPASSAQRASARSFSTLVA